MSKKMIIFENPDKENNEKINYKNPASLPCPYRLICVSTPSCGKTNTILNIIYNASPEFKKIYLLHLDEESCEYDFFDIIKLDKIPNLDFFKKDRNEKKLLIIEEFSFKNISKIDLEKIDHLFKYVSSHYNLTIILSCQVYYNVPYFIRKQCNYLCIWNSSDKVLLKGVNNVIPYHSNKEYENLIKRELTSQYDNLILCKNDKYIIKNLHNLIEM